MYIVLKPEKEGQKYWVVHQSGGRCFQMRNEADAEDLIRILNGKELNESY